MPHGIGQEGETVRRLLESAAAEFARHGFAAARVRDIVDAAGANLAAVNYHFGGKEGLYRATLALLARRTQEEVSGESTEVRRLAPEDRLHIFTLLILQRLLGGAQASPMSRILAHELLDPTPAFQDVLRDVAAPQFERLSDIVARLLGPRANADEIALATFSIAGQWAFYLLGRPALERLQPDLVRDPSVIARLAQQISDFSVAALRARRVAIESATRDAGPSPSPAKSARKSKIRPAPARKTRKGTPRKAGAAP